MNTLGLNGLFYTYPKNDKITHLSTQNNKYQEYCEKYLNKYDRLLIMTRDGTGKNYIETSETLFFDNFYLILKNIHEKREKLIYSFIVYFKFFVDSSENENIKNLYNIVNELYMIYEEYEKNNNNEFRINMERKIYDSSILLTFSELLSPENEDYEENIKLMMTCFSEHNWSDLLDYYNIKSNLVTTKKLFILTKGPALTDEITKQIIHVYPKDNI